MARMPDYEELYDQLTQAREEIARWQAMVTSNVMHVELTQLRAERDACVAALKEVHAYELSIADGISDSLTASQWMGQVEDMAGIADKALAQLPHAALRARLVADVMQAARYLTGPHGTVSQGYEALNNALAALDAHDQGKGGG